MKKLLLSLVMLLASSLSAHAVLDMDFAITGGYHLTKTKLDKTTLTQTLDGKNGSGWYIGPKVQLGLALGFSVEGAALYSQREIAIANATAVKVTEKQKSILVPVNARYDFGLFGTGVYVATGPEFGFSLDKKEWNISSLLTSNGTLPSVTDILKPEKTTTTWNIGAGVRFTRFEVGVVYNMPLGDAGKSVLTNAGIQVGQTPSYKLNTFSVQASIYF